MVVASTYAVWSRTAKLAPMFSFFTVPQRCYCSFSSLAIWFSFLFPFETQTLTFSLPGSTSWLLSGMKNFVQITGITPLSLLPLLSKIGVTWTQVLWCDMLTMTGTDCPTGWQHIQCGHAEQRFIFCSEGVGEHEIPLVNSEWHTIKILLWMSKIFYWVSSDLSSLHVFETAEDITSDKWLLCN